MITAIIFLIIGISSAVAATALFFADSQGALFLSSAGWVIFVIPFISGFSLASGVHLVWGAISRKTAM